MSIKISDIGFFDSLSIHPKNAQNQDVYRKYHQSQPVPRIDVINFLALLDYQISAKIFSIIRARFISICLKRPNQNVYQVSPPTGLPRI